MDASWTVDDNLDILIFEDEIDENGSYRGGKFDFTEFDSRASTIRNSIPNFRNAGSELTENSSNTFLNRAIRGSDQL